MTLSALLRAGALALAMLAAPAAQPARAATPQASHAPASRTQDSHAQDAHAGDDHGDHGAHHEAPGVVPKPEQGIIPAIMTLLVFGGVLLVLYLKVWPALTKGLDDRANKIREEIEAAELARRQARAALDEYERNLADARAEAQKMLEKTREDQQRLAGELRAKADAELTELRRKAMSEIEGAKRAALSEIYQHAAALAVTAAGKILQREITPTDQQRLIDESLAELQARN